MWLAFSKQSFKYFVSLCLILNPQLCPYKKTNLLSSKEHFLGRLKYPPMSLFLCLLLFLNFYFSPHFVSMQLLFPTPRIWSLLCTYHTFGMQERNNHLFITEMEKEKWSAWSQSGSCWERDQNPAASFPALFLMRQYKNNFCLGFFLITEDYQDCHGSADNHCGSFWLKEVQGEHHKVLVLIWTSLSPLKLTEKPLELLHMSFENDLWACLLWLMCFFIYPCEFFYSHNKASRVRVYCRLLYRSVGT